MNSSAQLLRPPALACWILESVVPSPSPDAMVGDLIEEYADRAADDRVAAARWFWSQTLRSLPFLILSALRTEWLLNLSVAVITYLLLEVLKAGVNGALSGWVTQPTTWIFVAPITFVTLNAISGVAIARVRRGAAVTLSALVMLTVLVMSIAGICRTPVPWWYQFGFFAVAPLSILIPPALRPWRLSVSP